MAERVISKAASAQPAPAAKSGAGKGADAKAEADQGEEVPEDEEAVDEAENGSAEAEEGDEPELDENEPVSGVTAEDLAAGSTKARPKRKVPKVPQIPDGHIAVLSSPRDFGIWIDGALHRFKKGRTPLTDAQHDAAHLDEYVRDNGASVSYRPKGK